MLVGIVVGLAISAGVILFKGIRTVHAREAAVVYNRLTGEVRDLFTGPSLAFVMPWLEEVQILDVAQKRTGITVPGIATADWLSVAGYLEVYWQLNPQCLQSLNLNEVLPSLSDPLDAVRRSGRYALSTLLGQYSLPEVLNQARLPAVLETALHVRLQALVEPIGVTISAVRLTCQPEAGILNARLSAQAQAVELATLDAVLKSLEKLDAVMRFQMLEALRKSNPQLVTAFTTNGGDPSEGPGHVQFVVGR